jgi:hypothetical protein
MPVSGDQISRVDAKSGNRDNPSNSRTSNSRIRSSGSHNLAEKEVKFEHSEHSDVLYVDYFDTPEGITVTTIEIGDILGFPGQVQARVNLEDRVLYGITIQNYSGFRRRLVWRYKTGAVRAAILLLLNSIRAGVLIDNFQAPQPC